MGSRAGHFASLGCATHRSLCHGLGGAGGWGGPPPNLDFQFARWTGFSQRNRCKDLPPQGKRSALISCWSESKSSGSRLIPSTAQGRAPLGSSLPTEQPTGRPAESKRAGWHVPPRWWVVPTQLRPGHEPPIPHTSLRLQIYILEALTTKWKEKKNKGWINVLKTQMQWKARKKKDHELNYRTINCLCLIEPYCSATQSSLTLRDPMNSSMPGFPVLHCLPEIAQSHVHWVDDATQPSHLLSPPSPYKHIENVTECLLKTQFNFCPISLRH